MSVNVATVVQARTGSTRLPDKVRRHIDGVPMLHLQLQRMGRSDLAGSIVVAIPSGRSDDGLARDVLAWGHTVVRGDSEDLIGRHLLGAQAVDAEVVAKIPSDCPLIDPGVIDRVIRAFLADRFDYVSNLHPATWPDGQDVEVMRLTALQVAHDEATRAFEREHTTPFIWERPDRFRLGNVCWGTDRSMDIRLTVDYPEDLALIERIVGEIGIHASIDEIVQLVDTMPEIASINAGLRGVNWYRHHLEELRTVGARDTRYGPGELG